jgi:hypothetical protein
MRPPSRILASVAVAGIIFVLFEAAIKSGTPTLVVAGALHFSGPRSVIARLQKRGYKIEQL